MGPRLELMVLQLAETVALRFYRALHDGVGDVLVSQVAARILADEERHVPFHNSRLRLEFAGLSAPARAAVTVVWWLLMVGTIGAVTVDHGAALRRLGVRRGRFGLDVARLFRGVVADASGPVPTADLRLPRR
jgi:hypothetical protein